MSPPSSIFSSIISSSLSSVDSLSLLVTCSVVFLAAALKFTLVLLVSYLARRRRHHALHPTRHSSVRSQQDLEQIGEWKGASHLICQFYAHCMGLRHLCCYYKPLTCLCCWSCCCSSCSLSVSNTTGSTRIIKEVVPTQSAAREKLKHVHIPLKLCCLCRFSCPFIKCNTSEMYL